ncbi:MAG: signal peptidase I, partial [Lachnospiraceae bacterium]|nr:signal peptidase I [Lachnospiraceae bacterium]
KRIIGLPGETVRIDTDGKIYVNEALLDENYGYETIEDPGRAIETLVLGEDEYFVLGDNRNNSRDSRDPMVGNISRDRIVGKAFIRIYPFDKFGVLKHQ